MKNYSIMPQDWDYSHEEGIKSCYAKGCYAPSMVMEAVGRCGSLFPFITTKKDAIRYAKSLKEDFPFITFGLMEGDAWGEMKLVQSF